MKNLPNLFKLMELTRAQVQYGYLMSGMRKDQLSNLAEHHYLVTFIGWQLALNLKEAGANIDAKSFGVLSDSRFRRAYGRRYFRVVCQSQP